MRVAICYSGFLRNFHHTYARAKMFCFDVLQPDIFFAGYPNRSDPKSCDQFQEMYKPKRMQCIEYSDDLRDKLKAKHHADWNRHGSTNYEGLLSQYTNLYHANRLKNEYEKENGLSYDVVIKARLDMFWSRPVMPGELAAAKAGFLLAPGTWDFKTVNAYAMTDVFAMSNSLKMDIYSDVIHCIDQYNRAGCACHHESFTGWHARATGLDQYRVSVEPHLWFEYPVEFDHLPLEKRDRKLY